MNSYSCVRRMCLNYESENLQCDFLHVHEAVVEKVSHAMPGEDVLFDLSELFKVFGDSTKATCQFS